MASKPLPSPLLDDMIKKANLLARLQDEDELLAKKVSSLIRNRQTKVETLSKSTKIPKLSKEVTHFRNKLTPEVVSSKALHNSKKEYEFGCAPPVEIARIKENRYNIFTQHSACTLSATQSASVAAAEEMHFEQAPAQDLNPTNKIVDVLCPNCRWIMSSVLFAFFQVIIYTCFSLRNADFHPPPAVVKHLGYSGNLLRLQPYRLFTSLFLHDSMWHLVINSASQLQFGIAVENRGGALRYWTVLAMSGLVGNLAAGIFQPCKIISSSSSIGAAFLGYQIAEAMFLMPLLEDKLPAVVAAMSVIVHYMFIHWTSRSGHVMHIAAFLVGLLIGFTESIKFKLLPKWHPKLRKLSFLLLLSTSVLLVFALKDQEMCKTLFL